jgi:hypothetical protein
MACHYGPFSFKHTLCSYHQFCGKLKGKIFPPKWKLQCFPIGLLHAFYGGGPTNWATRQDKIILRELIQVNDDCYAATRQHQNRMWMSLHYTWSAAASMIPNVTSRHDLLVHGGQWTINLKYFQYQQCRLTSASRAGGGDVRSSDNDETTMMAVVSLH